ncbi:DUF4097 family beta strand repeat-containing protein [Humidisolicoccus flavus]|uniref:DUF4097 family beta strand repeat-containing protein n=1 Tax=Humidisolicoccus flavus TaxID=3111414 RepID=UPI003250CBE1
MTSTNYSADEVDERWKVAPGESRTIEIAAPHKLRIGVIGGRLDIVGTDEEQARIEVHSVTGIDLLVEFDGRTLRIDHPRKNWEGLKGFAQWIGKGPKVDLSIAVPRAVALSLAQVNAEILVSELEGKATINTVSGDVQLDGHRGNVEFNSVSGDLEASDQHGELTAHTTSGSVTASGALRDVSIDSVAGTVMLDITGDPKTVGLNSVSGDATLRFDQGLPVRGSLRSIGARATIDGVVVERSNGIARFGSTGVVIDMNSVTGGLTVLRRAGAARAAGDER